MKLHINPGSEFKDFETNLYNFDEDDPEHSGAAGEECVAFHIMKLCIDPSSESNDSDTIE
jgi:hypothetical protein